MSRHLGFIPLRAFVRGCPARGVLGGLSRYTHDVVLLCQVAGYDPVIVETVGLGQNEVTATRLWTQAKKIEAWLRCECHSDLFAAAWTRVRDG